MEEILRELREIRDQIRGEHEPERLQRAIREVVTRPAPSTRRLASLDASDTTDDTPALRLKDVLGRAPRDAREHELQRLNDRIYLCSALLRRDPRSLKSYRDFQVLAGELRKALNTVDNEELVPEGFSISLVEEVRLQRRLPSLFESVTLPRSPLRWPVEGSIGLPFLIAENLGDTGEKVPTRSPATEQVTFSARTIAVRVPFSREFDEDSVIAAEDYVRGQIAKALTDGLETAILNGDDSDPHMDGVVTAGNDVRRIFRGLRKLARVPSSATETDLATFSQSTWATARRKMGAYGIDPAELVCILSPLGYYRIIGDATGWSDFQTVDRIGPRAINVTGEVGAIYGVPVVVSAHAPESCSNTAVDAGTGHDAVMLIANRRAYGLATQVGATIETVWDPEALQFKVIGYQRVDFKPWFDAATQRAVSVGYNIDVS